MTKRLKLAVAVAALAAVSTSSTAYAAGATTNCAKIWNLIVLAKKCP